MENKALPQIITTTELEVEVSSPHPFDIFHSINQTKSTGNSIKSLHLDQVFKLSEAGTCALNSSS